MRKALLTAALSIAVVVVGPGTAGAQASRLSPERAPDSASAVAARLDARLSVRTSAAQDADWILRAQLPDGAIATQVDRRHIQPYFANSAAKGLAMAARDTGDPRYAAAAWRWLRWYAAHEGHLGYVTDYDVAAGGQQTSTGAMDSTDAYAGTYLIAVQAIWSLTRNRSQLVSLQHGIVAAVGAIESTQDSDGLTWAKPGWHVKYLMDQGEAFAGLRAAVLLGDALGNRTLADQARADAAAMTAGVAALWNPATGSYDWAKFGNGARRATDWTKLYPDAAQQPWAVAFGLVPAPRATALMRRFDAAQPNWYKPAALAKSDTGSAPVGYWPAIGSAFLRVGDVARAGAAYTAIRGAALTANRAWPFNTAPAGELLVLAHR